MRINKNNEERMKHTRTSGTLGANRCRVFRCTECKVRFCNATRIIGEDQKTIHCVDVERNTKKIVATETKLLYRALKGKMHKKKWQGHKIINGRKIFTIIKCVQCNRQNVFRCTSNEQYVRNALGFNVYLTFVQSLFIILFELKLHFCQTHSQSDPDESFYAS